MSKKKNKKQLRGGLGRSLDELLSDNNELTNMSTNVTMHREDGSTVKIYNKSDKKPQIKTSYTEKKRRGVTKTSGLTFGTASEIAYNTASPKNDKLNSDDPMGKSSGLSNSTDAASRESIIIPPISRSQEAEPSPIIIDGHSHMSVSTAEKLSRLGNYSPSAKDSFLEDLLEISESTPSKSYKTDKEGRIIIGAPNRSKVKKR